MPLRSEYDERLQTRDEMRKNRNAEGEEEREEKAIDRHLKDKGGKRRRHKEA